MLVTSLSVTEYLINHQDYITAGFQIDIMNLLINSTFCKKTFMGRLANILNTWLGFHKDIIKLLQFSFCTRIFSFFHLINKLCIYQHLNTAIDQHGSTQTPSSSNATLQAKQYFYKLPYLGNFLLQLKAKYATLLIVIVMILISN